MPIIEVRAEVDVADVVDDVFDYLPDNEIFERIKDDELFQEAVSRAVYSFQHFFDYFKGELHLLREEELQDVMAVFADELCKRKTKLVGGD